MYLAAAEATPSADGLSAASDDEDMDKVDGVKVGSVSNIDNTDLRRPKAAIWVIDPRNLAEGMC
jgi:hypothetical protein